MIVAFCGHSKDVPKGIKEKILDVLKAEIKDESVEFYLGGYGEFDALAAESCIEYRKENNNAKLYFITPYNSESYLDNRSVMLSDFDGYIYPDIERVPKRYAIVARNEYMVEKADLVIAYVNSDKGGAAKTLKYACKLYKRYINLGSFEFVDFKNINK